MDKNSNFKNRDATIDIVKGLGIIFMVVGHSGSPITKFIYLFHMALFFIASGYCFKSKNSDSIVDVSKYIKKRFSSLWVTYVLWITIYSLLHNFFIKINVYTDNPILLEYVQGQYVSTTRHWSVSDILSNIKQSLYLRGSAQMAGAFWFIAILMVLTTLYCIIDYLIKKIVGVKDTTIIQTLFSVFFLGIGYWCFLNKRTFEGFERALSYYILFHGGIILNKYKISAKARVLWKHLAILFVTFGILVICNQYGEIGLSQSNYKNPVFLLIVSFIGWQFVYEIAFFLQKNEFVKKILVYIGQNTMAIVVLHFLSFKIVSYIGVLLKGQPHCLVAAFPILYEGGVWWIAYVVVGIFVPLFINAIYKKVLKMIRDKRHV